MFGIALVLVVLLGLAHRPSGLPPGPSSAAAAVVVQPAITTHGVQFRSASGDPVILRGVDLSYHTRFLSYVPSRSG